MLGEVALLIAEIQRVVPLVERIIEAHPQPFSHHRLGQIAGQVAVWAHVHAVPVPARWAWPKAKALMMFRSQNDITRTCTCKQVGPLIGIVELGLKLARKILVLEVRPIVEQMKRPRGPVLVLHVIPIPLCVRLANLRVWVRKGRD